MKGNWDNESIMKMWDEAQNLEAEEDDVGGLSLQNPTGKNILYKRFREGKPLMRERLRQEPANK